MATCYDCFHWKVCRNILESMNHDLKGKKITICSTCEKFTPTTDVVEVVRCKDCKHWKQVNEERRACYLLGFEMDYDEFCSYGTPKERGRNK